MKAGPLALPPAGVLLTVGIGELVVTADRTVSFVNATGTMRVKTIGSGEHEL